MTKYSVSVGKIFPAISESELLQNKECIIGISMSNPVYWRSSLNEILKWSAQHFEKTHLVVGDFLNRFNERILTNESMADAEKRSVELGNRFIDKLNGYLSEYPKEKFNVIRWIDLVKDNKNKEEIADLFNIYHSNEIFKEAIDKDAAEYIESQKRRGKIIQVPNEEAIELSASYLLEELAIFNKMIGEGLKVLVYPGIQLSLLTEIAEGDFSEMSDHLQNGFYVQLKVIKT